MAEVRQSTATEQKGHATVLEVQNISKRFPASSPDDVNLQFMPEIYAVVGENGAGKSTRMKIVSAHIPDTGRLFRMGTSLLCAPCDAQQKGSALSTRNSICP
jgi:ABC-type sugar transport system ATPase subunit